MSFDFDDDELIDGLESDSPPMSDFDVAANLKRLRKLEYKLDKQKEYKSHVEEKLKAGVKKTEDAVKTIRANILTYMQTNGKDKLSFDDVGTVSLTNKNKKEFVITDEEALLRELKSDDYWEAFLIQQEPKINKKDLEKFLDEIEEYNNLPSGLVYRDKDPGLQIKKK